MASITTMSQPASIDQLVTGTPYFSPSSLARSLGDRKDVYRKNDFRCPAPAKVSEKPTN